MRNALRYMGRCVSADWRLWWALVEVMIAVTSHDAWIFAYAGILVAWEVADRMSEITKALHEPKVNVFVERGQPREDGEEWKG